jgi:ABC-type dipeptide/oligopeptide/nickel transport system permease subunit
MALFPGLALTFTVLAFNMVGDSLRDMFDPRVMLKRKRNQ